MSRFFAWGGCTARGGASFLDNLGRFWIGARRYFRRGVVVCDLDDVVNW